MRREEEVKDEAREESERRIVEERIRKEDEG